jgi:hypothetical protein
MTTSQKWRCLFRSPFILQTFAAHLSAIEGSQKVLDLHDSDKPTTTARGALGLSVASVSFLCICLSCYANLY